MGTEEGGCARKDTRTPRRDKYSNLSSPAQRTLLGGPGLRGSSGLSKTDGLCEHQSIGGQNNGYHGISWGGGAVLLCVPNKSDKQQKREEREKESFLTKGATNP